MIFITGAACSGKSSVVKELKEKLPEDKYDIHDIDEADKWANDYESWRNAKIEYWLLQSIANRKRGKETILCGIIFPEDVEKSKSFEAAQPVKYVLLDAEPDEIEERYLRKMKPWLNRQKQIAKELKSKVAAKKERLIDTTLISSSEAAEEIARVVLK